MPTLRNARHELFAQKLAAGFNQTDAHEAAGFPRSTSNASTLAKRPEVRDRVRELLEEEQGNPKDLATPSRPNIEADSNGDLTPASIAITEEWLVKMLMDNIVGAQRDSKYKEANAGIEMLGNYFGGLFSPKNTTDKSKDQGSPDDPSHKVNLAEMMQRMNDVMAQPDTDDDDE